MEFIEIDPLVSQVANDYFTYLKKSPATIQVRLGDGRTVLRESPDAQYGLIVMDAFSSDAVPTHLVTLEALRCYTNKLAKDGAIMINATSRYYDFAPLMAGLARELNMTLLHGNDYHVNQGREGEMIYVSNWYVLTNNKKLIDTVKKDALWEAVNLSNSDSSVVWTDNYANQFDLLKIIDKTSDVITD